MRVKYGNTTKDVSILEVTPENYIVPKGEEGVYHCRIEQKSFNASTGERQSRPRIQKFEPKMWPMLSPAQTASRITAVNVYGFNRATSRGLYPVSYRWYKNNCQWQVCQAPF